MVLINRPEFEETVSDKAINCPHCVPSDLQMVETK